MKRGTYTFLRWVSIVFLFLAVFLTVFELVRFSRARLSFPMGTTIGGVAVGGLDQQQTADRLTQAYSVPLEVTYGDNTFHINPANLGFKLRIQDMITAADVLRVQQPFWSAFWEYLWNKQPKGLEIPLSADISDKQLRTFLQDEIASRYDLPPEPATPLPGSTVFSAGKPGQVLNIDEASAIIKDALRSPGDRRVTLSYSEVKAARPSFNNLGILLKQIIDASAFDGLSEIYLLDLATGQEINFARWGGEDYPPGISFSAASSIKIPVMISIMRRSTEPMSSRFSSLMEEMIDQSDNASTDLLMQEALGFEDGPLVVTEDMQKLGLDSTFLVGYFYVGAPLLKVMQTPGNSRTDINTNPDNYNQTTPSEIGMLLEDIYHCSNTGEGTFSVVFPSEITKTECLKMIQYLQANKIAILLQAGLPDGTSFAHKQGYAPDFDGLIHSASDVGIVYSPGGNFVISYFMYHPVQWLFDPANRLAADIASAVYNYYNSSE